MIKLSNTQLIARGWHRECYQHPNNHNLCIKVVVNGDERETRREQAFYRLLNKRKVECWDHIPKFHGNQLTDKGMGAVFDLVRDHDGQVANTLHYYLNDASHTSRYASSILTAMRELKNYQKKHNIITMSLKPKNLLFRLLKSGQGEIVIIDNLGNADFFPISSYMPCLGKRKIERKWQSFKQFLNKHYSDHVHLLTDQL